MQKKVYYIFLLLFSLIPIESSSAADLSQCPENWRLKLTAGYPGSYSGGTPFPKEIQVIQKEMGKDLAVRQISAEVKNDDGKWVTLPEENVQRISIALLGKPYRIQYSIATIKCPDPFFTYAEGIFPEPTSEIVSMTPKAFISKYLANSPLDFQKLSEIEKNIYLCVDNMKKAANESIDGKISSTFGWVTPKCDTPDTYFETEPIFHQIECFNWSRDYNFYLRAGQVCDVSLRSNGVMLLTFQLKGPDSIKPIGKKVDSQSTFFTSEEIELAKSKKKTILCIKGKVTKKVTAVSPKCPAGYKKK